MHLSIQNIQYKICNQLNSPVPNKTPQNSSNNSANNIKELSNICYKPNFTSNSEGQFFECRKEALINKMRANYVSEDIINDISDLLTDGNISLAEILLFDKKINKREIDIPEILKNTTADNADIAKDVCYNPNIRGNLKPIIISVTTHKTKELAKNLIDEINPIYIDNILEVAQYGDNLQTAGTLCSAFRYDNKPFPVRQIKLLPEINQDDIDLLKIIYINQSLSENTQREYLENITDFNMPLIRKMYGKDMPDELLIHALSELNSKKDYLDENDIEELIGRVEYQRGLIQSNPQHYIRSIQPEAANGYRKITPELFGEIINSRYTPLILVVSIFDKETTDVIFSKRENFSIKYIDKINKLKYSDYIMLKKLAQCSDRNGNSYNPTQKIEFIDMVSALNSAPNVKEIANKMIDDGRVDIEALNRRILKIIYDNMGLSEEQINSIPYKKNQLWDIKLVHMLAAELNRTNYTKPLHDMIKAASFGEFTTYINSSDNIYGQTNLQTKKMFNENKLNYSKWLNPDTNLEINFITADDKVDIINIMSEQTEEDIEFLRQSNPKLKKLIDKLVQPYIQNDKFVIPDNYRGNKLKLENLVKNIIVQFDKIWKQAEANKSIAHTKMDSELLKKATDTLMIQYHLIERYNALEILDDKEQNQNYNLTIKNWDRIPQKDLFQGNYSTCCLALGKGSNSNAMPQYLLNTAFNMIEIKDNDSGEIIGNALCYWIKTDKFETPILAVDNIEINNLYKPSEKIGYELRNAIIKYAKNLASYTSNGRYNKVILGKSFNDIPTNDLKPITANISLIGNISANDIYLDLYGGKKLKTQLENSDVELYLI